MANLNSNVLHVEQDLTKTKTESLDVIIIEEKEIIAIAGSKPPKRFAGRISKETADDLQR